MSYTAYSKYQPARHLWLDQIPSHWDSVNIRLIAKRSSGGTPDKSNSLFWSEGTIPWLNSGEVNQGVITEPTTYITEDALSQSSAKWIPPNSIIIALAGQGKTKGMAAITTFRTTCNQSMAAVIFETDHPKFMYWWLVSQYKNIRGMASDDARDGLNLEMIATIPCPRPSDDEQQKIAAFLDWKTGQIDALIAKKKELIEKLKEKRLAVITRAITKGLNAAVPLRDSGIAWIGRVPQHWDVLKIKFVSTLASGHTPSRSVEEYWIDCNIPWVSLNDSKMLREKDSISETHYQISELGLANSSAKLLPAGVVVFSRDATVGLCAITEVPMAVSQHFVAYICGEKLLGKYLLFALKAMNQHLLSLQTGSTIVTIGMPEIRSLTYPMPSMSEQIAVVDHIDTVATKIDQMLDKVESAIGRLTEYRTALITAATTGKIDVRNVAVPAHT